MPDADGRLLWALATSAFVAIIAYLVRVNQQLSGTPEEVRRLVGPMWTPELLRKTYERLQRNPIEYAHKLPPRLERRYIVTGGSGLVGGYIVLQLLARGTPPSHIRIVDIRRAERSDMQSGPAADEVDFAQTDITSSASVSAAFSRPWPEDAAKLPLTVFHTAAVILASDRSAHSYAFPHAVNVRGTAHVISAARAAGASVFSATSSASIAIRPVGVWALPWATQPRDFFQVLDTKDFEREVRGREGYFGNYPASKAVAERLVCDLDGEGFRTGTIRPANGVYGNPTDNTVGDPLSRAVMPTWVAHIAQSFVHGANVAIAHLHHEAALVRPSSLSATHPHSGRPFVVTDPNPPITYGDLYSAIRVLSRHSFTTVSLPPVLMLLISHAVEIYAELPYSLGAWLSKLLPPLQGDVQHLKPGLFSITTHLVASNAEAGKPVAEGGLGYEGVLTTLEGMVLEVLEWNREHEHLGDGDGSMRKRKAYTTSVSLAQKLQKLGAVGHQVAT
ncbi:NAD(P)-binding protein [Nemania sp. FL0916]|nr:NAD(P)-binding protein [Nemania sp. FL0916]